MSEEIPRSGVDRRKVVITSATLMPLGLVIAIVLALWRGSSMLDDRFNVLQKDIQNVNNQLVLIKLSSGNCFTVADARLWTTQLKVANPSLIVPDVMDVVRTGRPATP